MIYSIKVTLCSGISPLNLGRDACKGNGEGKVSDYEGEGDGEEIFSHKVHQLVIAEAGVGGSNSKEDD